MEYPFRFEDPKVGDVVYGVASDEHNIIKVEKVTISEVYDHSYDVRTDQVSGWHWHDGRKRYDDWEGILIGFWIKEYTFGHAQFFGETLFLTEAEALEDATELEKLRKEESNE